MFSSHTFLSRDKWLRSLASARCCFLLTVLLTSLFFCGCTSFRPSPQTLYHRAWQATQDSIYDPASLGDWKQWEHKQDGKLKTDDDATKAINEMLASVHDRYTYFLDTKAVQAERQAADGHIVGIGIVFQVKQDGAGNAVKGPDGKPMPDATDDGYPMIGEVVDGSPAEMSGVQVGDAVISIDGRATSGLSVDTLVNQVRGNEGTTVKLEIRHSGAAAQNLALVRQQIKVHELSTRHLPDGIGYLRLEDFAQNSTVEDFKNGLADLKDCRMLVIDLRSNPGGLIRNAVGASSLFIKQGKVVTIKERIAKGGYTTTVYRLTSSQLLQEKLDDNGKVLESTSSVREPYMIANRPVVLLANDGTASAAEMMTGALRDNGAVTVLGVKTFGKGIGQSRLTMPNGTELHVTSLHYFTPSGAWLGDGHNSVSYGIVPDLEVQPNDGLVFGDENDNQLKAAIDVLLSGGTASKHTMIPSFRTHRSRAC